MKGGFKTLVDSIWKRKQEFFRLNAIGKVDKASNLGSISTSLDEFYFLEKLKLYCTYLSRNKMLPHNLVGATKEDFKLINDILEELEQNNFDNPSIQIFLLIKELYTFLDSKDVLNKENQLFEEVVALTEKYEHTFIHEEQIEIYSYLSNYALKRLNEGNLDYLSKVINIYNAIFNVKFKGVNNRTRILSANIYKNVVSLSLLHTDSTFWENIKTPRLKSKVRDTGFASAEEWVKLFINQYRIHIPKENRLVYYSFCKAKLLFYQKNHRKVFYLLHPLVGAKGLYIHLDIKLLYLQTIYELNCTAKGLAILSKEDIDFKLVLRRFKKALDENRKKKIAYQIEYYDTFYDLYNSCYQLDYNSRRISQSNKEQLRKKIEECRFITYNNWFRILYQKITTPD